MAVSPPTDSAYDVVSPAMWRRWRYAAVWIVGIVLAVISEVLAMSYGTQPIATSSPESAVQNYLDAVHAREVDTALGFVDGAAVPTGQAARYLDERALDSHWTVSAVVEGKRSGDGTRATVHYSIASGGHTSPGTFRLKLDAAMSSWRITNPFVSVKTAASPLESVPVNGYAPPPQALATAGRDGYEPVRPFYLFPGRYGFAKGLPDTVRLSHSRAGVLLPREDGDATSLGSFSATSKAVAAVQKQLDERIDDCARLTAALPQGCPFGIYLPTFPTHASGDWKVVRIDEAKWTVDQRPKITLAEGKEDAKSSEPGFTVDSSVTATVRLSAVGYAVHPHGHKAGRSLRFTSACTMFYDGFRVMSNLDGSVSLITRPITKQAADLACHD